MIPDTRVLRWFVGTLSSSGRPSRGDGSAPWPSAQLSSSAEGQVPFPFYTTGRTKPGMGANLACGHLFTWAVAPFSSCCVALLSSVAMLPGKF